MKRIFTLGLCLVFVHGILSADAFALQSNLPAPSRQAAKVSGVVARLGSGDGSVVALRLQDRTVLKGRIASIDRDSFTVSDLETAAERRVVYADVVRLEGFNAETGARAHVGGGFRAGVVRGFGLLLPSHRVQANALTGNEKTLLLGIVVGVLLAIILAKVL
jgi:hypothetical protein